MNPLVSIIIPIYNAGGYLERSIYTAINQTYTNIEILLLDDGSFDASVDICKRYEKKYENIYYYDNQNANQNVSKKSHQGVGKMRQKGIQLAKGNYVCFLDADDYMDIHFVEKMLAVAKETDADIVNCGFYEAFQGGKCLERNGFSGEFNQADFLKEMFINANVGTYFWNRLWKKELFSKIDISDQISFEDLATTCKLVLEANKIVGIEESLYYYIHENTMSLTANWNGEKSSLYFKAHEDAKKTICDKYPQLEDVFEIVLVKAAMHDCKALYKNKKSNKEILKRIHFDWIYIQEHKNLLSKKEQMEADLICKSPKITRSLLLAKAKFKKWNN